MNAVLHRTRPDRSRECEQWSLISESDLVMIILHERLRFWATLGGATYIPNTAMLEIGDFLGSNQDPAATRKLQVLLKSRDR